MSGPTVGQRAAFMAIVCGMAREYDYTLAALIRDIRTCWRHVKKGGVTSSEAAVATSK